MNWDLWPMKLTMVKKTQKTVLAQQQFGLHDYHMNYGRHWRFTVSAALNHAKNNLTTASITNK